MKTLDELLAQCQQERKTEAVEVFGETFIVREMSASERDAYEQLLYGQAGDKKAIIRNIRATLVAFSVIDEHGNLRFGEDQIEAIGKLPVSGINAIFNASARLNAMSATDVKELEKN